MRRLLCVLLPFVALGCGGASSSVGIQLDGTWSGSMVQSTPKKTYAVNLTFIRGTLGFTGSYVDGSTQDVVGSGTSAADLTMTLANGGTPRTFFGSLATNSSNHLVGTFTESGGTVTLTVDLTSG